MRNVVGVRRSFAAALAFGAAAFAQDSTRIYVELSYDEIQWAPQLAFVPGQTINVRVRVAFEGTSTVLGFAGMTYQPTISPWPAGSTVLPFTTSDGSGVPDLPGNRGRLLPFAQVLMSSSSPSGLLAWHIDPDSALRFAGANATTMTTNLLWGVISARSLPLDPSPVTSAVVFKAAVVIDSSQPGLEYVFDVPLAGISRSRATWHRTPNGNGSLPTTISAADIHPARAYIGGNPCIFPPYITMHPAPFSCDSGQTARFNSAAEFGICGPFSSRWYHGPTPLVDDARVSGATTPSLTIRGVGLEDVGDYHLLASNGFGSSWSNPAMLQVLRCTADVDDGTGTRTPDGGVTVDDLLYFLVMYAGEQYYADLDDGSGTGMRDGGVTIDDLLYYLTRFAAGC